MVIVLITAGLALVFNTIWQTTAGERTEPEAVNVLATSQDECVLCHRKKTPGIIQQYGFSTLAAAKVTCLGLSRSNRRLPWRWRARRYLCAGLSNYRQV